MYMHIANFEQYVDIMKNTFLLKRNIRKNLFLLTKKLKWQTVNKKHNKMPRYWGEIKY